MFLNKDVYFEILGDNTSISTSTALIYLHDSLGCVSLWRDFPLVVFNLTGIPAIVYDRLGYGKSAPFKEPVRGLNYMELEADRLINYLNDWNISKAVLFGHSDGGSIALIAASKYPGRIAGIITEGAHVFVEEETLRGIRVAEQSYLTTNLKERLEKYHGANTDALFKAWTKTWQTPEFRQWNIEHFLPGVTCPALILQGVNDEFGTEEQVNSIVNKVNGYVESLMVPNSAHTPHKEAKELVLQHLIPFLKNSLS